jgi:L-ascorbate metabolism protein UlaG (beta-lactamase superfamily)
MRLDRAIAILLFCAASAGCSRVAQVEPARYAEPRRDHITFWGHACVYVDVGDVGIITDPVFEKHLYQRRRFIGSPPVGTIQRTRVILLSHAHDDHTSPSSLRMFPGDVTILAPEPAARYLDKQGIKAKAVRPGDVFELDGVRFIAVTVHHPGGRYGLRAAADGGALGWIIEAPTATIFYSGDTDYCSSFSHIGWTYSIDVAILNVNGHLRGVDASRAARALRAPVVIPTHWGAYGYWVVGGNRHPRDEEELKRALGNRLHVLDVGAFYPLEPGRKAP